MTYSVKSPAAGCFPTTIISLSGAASTLALDRYLKDHPEIHVIVAGLNNDTEEFGHAINAGQNGADKIQKGPMPLYPATVRSWTAGTTC